MNVRKEIQQKKKTIAIIVRKNRDVERVLTLLEANGIKASAERGADIFAHPIGALFFSLLEFLIDSSKTEALASTFTAGLWGLSLNESVQLIVEIRSGNLATLVYKVPTLLKLQKALYTSGAIEYLLLVGEVSGLTDRATESPLSAEVWRGIITLARDIADQNMVDTPRALIEALLSYRTSAETKSIKIATGRSDAQVHVMTAHGSKGLEYDCVFLPYATEEAWMSKQYGTSFILPREKDASGEVRDARRLFYVALTRAKSHATILYGLEEGLGRILTPLRFISELDTAHTKVINVPYSNEIPRGISLEKKEKNNKEEHIEYAKRVLLEKGLSVTALNHFCVCPSAFLYKSILKVPEAPSASSEKGNAMHEALSEVWKLKEKNEISITRIIQEMIQLYFAKSLLPLHEKEVVIDELVKNAPLVATALLPHFQSLGTVLTETWMETEYRGQYEGMPIALRLHGKLDAVLDSDKVVHVFDYKTRDAMSENAIRGNTKDTDGGYFRQLTYYKMLLQNNARYKEKEILPALVFIKPDDKGRCPIISLPIIEEDIQKVTIEIQTLIQSVWSGAFLTEICDDTNCVFCAKKKLLM